MSSQDPTAPPEQTALARPNDQRFAALYRELRQLADRMLRRNAGVSVSPTTVLHEAYLQISRSEAVFADHQRFLGYAARVMRGLIIDLVREHRALKRGGAFHITQLHEEAYEASSAGSSAEDSLDQLSESLDELAISDPRLAELVDLKYFCGYTFEEIAAQRGISVRTVRRDWQKARLVLFHKMSNVSGR